MRVLDRIYALLSKAAAVISWVSYTAVTAAALLTVADVIMRKLFASSIFGAYELMELLMSCTVFASFAYTQTKKGHIRVSMFIKKMSRVPAMVIYSLNEVLSFAIAAAVTYAAYRQIAYSVGKGLVTANLFIPLYPFYIVECVCMGLFAVLLLCDAAYSIIGIFNRDVSDRVLSEI